MSYASHFFAPQFNNLERPLFEFALGLSAFGAVYLAACYYVVYWANDTAKDGRSVFWVIVATGLAMRLVMFGSQPIQEIDYFRYLWDGAMTANGLNPWAYAPQDIIDGRIANPAVAALKQDAGPVLSTINYSDIRSIYPAVAQGFYALAYWIKPFSLEAWRGVLLLLELASLGLLVWLLRSVNKSITWVCIYWWNPIVIKEIMNSAHMEPVVMVPVLAAAVFAVQRRYMLATVFTSLAIAAKVWPVLLLPVIWRDLLRQPLKLAGLVALSALIVGVLYAPVIMARLDGSSGFVAFSTGWERISASFIILCTLASALPQSLMDPALLARLLAAILIGGAVIWSNRHPSTDGLDICRRFLIIAAAMLLLSPVQLPWYFVWLAPFLCIHPSRGLSLITITFPAYYAFFKLTEQDAPESTLLFLVWAMWLPVWGLLLYDWRKDRNLRPEADAI